MWGACVIDEVQDLDPTEDERRTRSEPDAKKSGRRNSKKDSEPKAGTESGLEDQPRRRTIQ